MTFETNNRGIFELEQFTPDGAVNVKRCTTYENGDKELDYLFKIDPGDFVLLLNHYMIQKSRGGPIV